MYISTTTVFSRSLTATRTQVHLRTVYCNFVGNSLHLFIPVDSIHQNDTPWRNKAFHSLDAAESMNMALLGDTNPWRSQMLNVSTSGRISQSPKYRELKVWLSSWGQEGDLDEGTRSGQFSVHCTRRSAECCCALPLFEASPS